MRSRAAWLLGAAAALPFCLIPVSDPDLPWHLASARWILENGALPRTDFLSWTKAGAAWTDFEWGAQLVLHAAHALGGKAGLWAFKASWMAGLLAAWAAWARRLGASRPASAAALPAAALALCPSLDARPEIFTFALALAQAAALEALRRGRLRPSPRLWAAHAAAYSLWACLHAGFALGLALIGAFWAGRAMDALLEGGGPREALGALRRAPEGRLLAAAALGSLLNPYGWGVHAVVLLHAGDSAVLARYIQEWNRPTLVNPYQAAFWLSTLFIFAALWRDLRRGRLSGGQLLAAALLGAAGGRSFRFIPYLPFLCLPAALASWLPEGEPAGRRGRAAAAAGLLLLWPAARVLANERPLSVLWRTERTDPAGAAAFLLREREALAGLRLFNPWDWGGSLGWRLHPSYKVFIDGRYLFADMLPALSEAERSPQGWSDYLREKGADLALLETSQPLVRPGRKEGAPWRPYTALSMPERDWALVYWDGQASVFVRRAAAKPAWLKAREYRFLRPLDRQRITRSVLAGTLPPEPVEREIRRHAREAPDPALARDLEDWLAGLKRDTPRAPKRMRAPAW